MLFRTRDGYIHHLNEEKINRVTYKLKNNAYTNTNKHKNRKHNYDFIGIGLPTKDLNQHTFVRADPPYSYIISELKGKKRKTAVLGGLNPKG